MAHNTTPPESSRKLTPAETHCWQSELPKINELFPVDGTIYGYQENLIKYADYCQVIAAGFEQTVSRLPRHGQAFDIIVAMKGLEEPLADKIDEASEALMKLATQEPSLSVHAFRSQSIAICRQLFRLNYSQLLHWLDKKRSAGEIASFTLAGKVATCTYWCEEKMEQIKFHVTKRRKLTGSGWQNARLEGATQIYRDGTPELLPYYQFLVGNRLDRPQDGQPRDIACIVLFEEFAIAVSNYSTISPLEVDQPVRSYRMPATQVDYRLRSLRSRRPRSNWRMSLSTMAILILSAVLIYQTGVLGQVAQMFGAAVRAVGSSEKSGAWPATAADQHWQTNDATFPMADGYAEQQPSR